MRAKARRSSVCSTTWPPLRHGGDPVDAIAMHAHREASGRVVRADPAGARGSRWRRPAGEWLALIDVHGRRTRSRASGFAADPVRTDLRAVRSGTRARSPVPTPGASPKLPFVGGARPDDVDWLHMQAPGWMLDRGWSLTAEVGGAARDGAEPVGARAPAIRVAQAQDRSDDRRARRPPHRRGRTRHRDRAAERIRWSRRFPVPPGFFTRVLTLPANARSAAAPPISRST